MVTGEGQSGERSTGAGGVGGTGEVGEERESVGGRERANKGGEKDELNPFRTAVPFWGQIT